MKAKEIIELLKDEIKRGSIKPDQEIKYRANGRYVPIDYILTKPTEDDGFAAFCEDLGY